MCLSDQLAKENQAKHGLNIRLVTPHSWNPLLLNYLSNINLLNLVFFKNQYQSYNKINSLQTQESKLGGQIKTTSAGRIKLGPYLFSPASLQQMLLVTEWMKIHQNPYKCMAAERYGDNTVDF